MDHTHSSIPSNSWFSVDSVPFMLTGRHCKLQGRAVHIAPDGRHVLCVDLRGHVEVFDARLSLLANKTRTLLMSGCFSAVVRR